MTSEWGPGDAMYLMVAVKDTGIGISKEGQAKLFERFRYWFFFGYNLHYRTNHHQTSNAKNTGKLRGLGPRPVYITQV